MDLTWIPKLGHDALLTQRTVGGLPNKERPRRQEEQGKIYHLANIPKQKKLKDNKEMELLKIKNPKIKRLNKSPK